MEWWWTSVLCRLDTNAFSKTRYPTSRDKCTSTRTHNTTQSRASLLSSSPFTHQKNYTQEEFTHISIYCASTIKLPTRLAFRITRPATTLQPISIAPIIIDVCNLIISHFIVWVFSRGCFCAINREHCGHLSLSLSVSRFSRDVWCGCVSLTPCVVDKVLGRSRRTQRRTQHIIRHYRPHTSIANWLAHNMTRVFQLPAGQFR